MPARASRTPVRATDGVVTDATPVRGAWRQPVVWLALLTFLAILAGCISMIVLAVRITDPADAPAAGQTIMKMPLERLPEAPRPSR